MKTRYFLVVICVIFTFFVASSSAVPDGEEDADPQGEAQTQNAQPYPRLTVFPEGVTVKRLSRQDTCVRAPGPGNWLELEFVATQMKDDGSGYERFDSTQTRNRPLMVEVGGDMKLPGLVEGLKEVCVGEQREITIQPGPLMEVDPNHGLKQPKMDREAIYVVTVRSIQDTKPSNIFDLMDEDKNEHLTREEVEAYFTKDGYPKDRTVEDILRMMFESQDKDEDGLISFDEFQGPKHNHDEF